MAIVPYEESYTNELIAFVDAIEGSKPLVSPLEAAAISAEITEAAQLSRTSGRFEPIAASGLEAHVRSHR
jgi:predicted dehydrogenase